MKKCKLLNPSELRISPTVPQMMAAEEKTLVEILEEHNPIDLAKYINYVSAPQAGAIATFSGTTRDTFEGKVVLELRYEAYTPMAIRYLKSICSSARSSWNLHSIAVAHRLGPVPVGETSVFIAISSVHRIDALDACKYVIDELKATVPIWKKEVLANGEVWKENSEFLERRLELGKKGWRLGKRLRPRCMTRRAAVGLGLRSMKKELPTTAPVMKAPVNLSKRKTPFLFLFLAEWGRSYSFAIITLC